MKSAVTSEPYLESTDLAGWQEVVAKGRLGEFSMEAIICAYFDLRPNSEPNIRHVLARYISDDMLRLLRQKVGRNKPNEGWDIIHRAHYKLWEALARPNSADAKGMRVAYAARVRFRFKDALVQEARERRVPDPEALPLKKEGKKDPKDKTARGIEPVEIEANHPDLQAAEEASDDAGSGSWIMRQATLLDGVRNIDEAIDVERFLAENVPNERKRLAFRMYMEDVPWKSKRSGSISGALNINESTARGWVDEILANLKIELGE